MAFAAADIDEFIAALHEDAGLRERVRSAILSDDFATLPGLMARLTERVDQQGINIDRLTERMDALAAHTEKMESQLELLTLEVSSLTRPVGRINGQLGNVDGRLFELALRDNLAAHLGVRFKRLRRISLGDYRPIDDALAAGSLSAVDFRDVMGLDVAAIAVDRSARTGGEVLLAIEVSKLVDANDVGRAHRRAAALSAAGLLATPVVVGEAITRGGSELAAVANVTVAVDKPDVVEGGDA